MKWIDLIFFRALGLALLIHETWIAKDSEWELIVAGMCMFLMPDVIGGKSSLPGKILERIIGGKDSK